MVFKGLTIVAFMKEPYKFYFAYKLLSHNCINVISRICRVYIMMDSTYLRYNIYTFI